MPGVRHTVNRNCQPRTIFSAACDFEQLAGAGRLERRAEKTRFRHRPVASVAPSTSQSKRLQWPGHRSRGHNKLTNDTTIATTTIGSTSSAAAVLAAAAAATTAAAAELAKATESKESGRSLSLRLLLLLFSSRLFVGRLLLPACYIRVRWTALDGLQFRSSC